MMGNTKSEQRTVEPEVRKALRNALEVIQERFEWEGFSPWEKTTDLGEKASDEPSELQIESIGKEEDIEDGEVDEAIEDIEEESVFDREDIEVGMDLFISRLIKEGLIAEPKLGRRTSFSGVFAKFFGEEHEITRTAKTFEKEIKGYFDLIEYEAMRSASENLLRIREMLYVKGRPHGQR